MTIGLRFADINGELGSRVSDRLSRVIFFDNLAGGASVTLPDINYVLSPVGGDGAIFVATGGFGGYRVLVDPGSQGLTWNNTTKVLTNTTGAVRGVLAVSFRRTASPAGVVGVVARNAGSEVLADNLYENLEIVAEGSTVINQAEVQTFTTLPTEYGPTLVFIRWDYANVAIIRGNNAQIMTTGTYGATTTIDWKVVARNPSTEPGSGPDPAMALYRSSDSRCTFSRRRKYARVRSLFAFDITSITVNGPVYPDGFSHAAIPMNAFFCMQPTYRTGSSAYAINRVDTGLAIGFLAGPVSGGQATSLGIPTLGSYAGAFHNTTLVIDP